MTCRPEPATTGPGRRRTLRALLAVSTASAGTTGVLAALPTTTSAATALGTATAQRRRPIRSACATGPNAKRVTHRIGGTRPYNNIDARPNNRKTTVTRNGHARNGRPPGSRVDTGDSTTLGRDSTETMSTASRTAG